MNQSDGPILRAFAWRSVVPFGHGGRMDDLAVHPGDPHTDFVGFAAGGLWKPANNRTTRGAKSHRSFRSGTLRGAWDPQPIACVSPQPQMMLNGSPPLRIIEGAVLSQGG